MLKKLALLPVLILLLAATAIAQTCDTSRADMNCDGFLTAADVVKLLKVFVGSCLECVGCSGLEPNRGDLNCDGFKDASDVVALLNCTFLSLDPGTCPPSNVRPTLADPQDSVIIESKILALPTGTLAGPCGSAGLKVRVYITNKDSLGNVTLPIQETSMAAGAYAIISRPSNCSAARTSRTVFDFIYPPIPNEAPRLGTSVPSFAFYHSNPPDSFLFSGTFDPTDRFTKLPPNLVRAALLDIKFDTVSSSPTCNGRIELDSVLYHFTSNDATNVIQFVDTHAQRIPINFVKGVITINPTGDLDVDGQFTSTDVVLILNCVFLGEGDCTPSCRADVNCDGSPTAADVVIQLNKVYLGIAYPCSP